MLTHKMDDIPILNMTKCVWSILIHARSKLGMFPPPLRMKSWKMMLAGPRKFHLFVGVFFFVWAHSVQHSGTKIYSVHLTRGNVFENRIHPRKLTWHLKIDSWKRRSLLETINFRFHVSFREGIFLFTQNIR